MAYADGIRAADTVTLDTIADLIEGICSATGPLAFASWTPTTSAVGGGSWSSISNSCKYAIIGDWVICHVHIFGTVTGTVNYVTITLPSASSGTTHGSLQIMEGGVTQIVPASTLCTSGSDEMRFYRYDDAALKATTTVGPSGWIFYRTA